jgi:hypothetical protein
MEAGIRNNRVVVLRIDGSSRMACRMSTATLSSRIFSSLSAITPKFGLAAIA